MKEKSAGAVIFRREDIIFFLLLDYERQNKYNYLDFPKGHIEEDEEEMETVKREVAEETGITDIKIIPGFRETIHYFFRKEGNLISKEVVFFIAETKEENVKISSEHKGYKWLPYEEALNAVTYKNAKNILKKAHDFISSQQPW